ncbi:sensor histidine kinase [Oscillibacter sp.]|uniref:sensor histidine kinase n=1 Tax=Oscillibacter sp. TaxID=1945593 RepID=UPI002D7E2FB3|nr:GHKL domain-containing protein [Oscillibacter sp.]
MTSAAPHPLQPVLELAVFFPAAFLCFLVTADHLRLKARTLALIALPVLTLACLLGGWLCWRTRWPVAVVLLPFLAVLGAAFCRVVTLPVWKSVSIFLAVCGVWGTLSCLAVIANAVLSPESKHTPWLCLAAGWIQLALDCLEVALVWYPATHAVRRLLREEVMVRTWYVFWTLPAAFFLFDLLILPEQGEDLLRGRLLFIYLALTLLLLGLLHLFYLLFYLMAQELNANAALRRENQFLQMQTAQYETLRAAIEEARRARHDLRHHFATLSALADRGAWEELRRYLSEAADEVPADELNLCENRAVDGVAGRYSALSRQSGVPFSCALDLPPALPVPEMDVCVVLQNLLENALEASGRLEGGRYIRLRASLRGDNLVLITVENAYGGQLEEREGVLQSSKRPGEGLGLQSVAHIAEKGGGYCRFLYGDGVFTANVMLRGGG